MATATNKAKTTQATITESLSNNVSVVREEGVIKNVKLIGFESKNGRSYPPSVLKAAVHLYEGAKVNIDHPERDPAQPRKYSERFGVIRNVRFVEGQGNFGDFHFNPKHSLAEQVCWDAEHNPEALGFSHNAFLKVGSVKQGKEVIEQIVSIRSMDLVADPATTKSLFESEEYPMGEETPVVGSTDPAEAIKSAFKQMILAAIDDQSLDMKATINKIKEIMKAQEKLMGGGASSSSGDDSETEEGLQLKQQNALLSQQLEQYRAKEKAAQRTEQINKELTAAGLDGKNPMHVSELFGKQLSATESEQDRLALIKDRAALLGAKPRTEGNTGGPVYRPQTSNAMEQMDAKSFANSILS